MKMKQNRCRECRFFIGAHCLAHNLPTHALSFCKLFEMRPELRIREHAFFDWLVVRYSRTSAKYYHAPVRMAQEAGLTEKDLLSIDGDEFYFMTHGHGCSKRTRDTYRRIARLYGEFLSSSYVVK